MRHGELPTDLELDRVTPDFDATTVPSGLLRAHQVGAQVWGVLEVVDGTVVFVWEDGPARSLELAAGDEVVIPPQVRHHVEPGADARFRVAFHR